MRCTSFFVGATGFEPATPWSQTRCATNCATPRERISNCKIKLAFNKQYSRQRITFLLSSGRQDSNLRPPGPKPGALPIAPRPEDFFHLQRTVFLNRRANLVLFFYKSNKMSVKMQNKLIIYKKPMERTVFYDFLSSLYPYP